MDAANSGQPTGSIFDQIRQWDQANNPVKVDGIPGAYANPGTQASNDGKGNLVLKAQDGTTVQNTNGGAYQVQEVSDGTKGAVGNGSYTLANGTSVTVSGLPKGQQVLFDSPVVSSGSGMGGGTGNTAQPLGGGTGGTSTLTTAGAPPTTGGGSVAGSPPVGSTGSPGLSGGGTTALRTVSPGVGMGLGQGPVTSTAGNDTATRTPTQPGA